MSQRLFSYKQLFLLILTIWSAEIATRALFDIVVSPQLPMEFRTVYLPKDPIKGRFLGGDLKELGRRGWQIVSVQPNPDDRSEMVVFMQRRAAIRLETTADSSD